MDNLWISQVCYSGATGVYQAVFKAIRQLLSLRAEEMHALTQRMKVLEDDLALLEAKHERLRGRFYATRGQDSPPQPETKADILRRHGYIPGRAMPTPTG